MFHKVKSRTILLGLAALFAAAVIGLAGPGARAADPIKIGFSMAETGPLAANGKSALLAMQIWKDNVNAKGGLLGRPVELVFYDDQSNPSTVPGIYTKLLDVDKVDLVVSGYATNMIAPAMPIVMQHGKVFIGLLGLAVNTQFKYDKYFAMIPSGQNPKPSFTKGFFDVAMAQSPKPTTVAIVAADAEFSRNAADGARANAKDAGLNIVYDKTYPPATTDFSPIVRAIQATNPDLVVVCSYPLDSIGMVRAINEIGLKPKMLGGAMVGLQSTSVKLSLGPLLNGIVNYDFWEPVPKMQFPGVAALLKEYQAKAPAANVDPLGYYMAPFGYTQLQVLGEAIQDVKSLDQDKIAAYLHTHTFETVLGNIAFGADGEWAEGRVIQIQFHGIKGHDVEQFRTMGTQTVVAPADYASGSVIYPYSAAQ
jgi:branched-chain amino acid transport system substrate-binding protein